MNKASCTSSSKNGEQKYIINCAGAKVPVSGSGFTSRCAIGNTDDYLKSFKDHIDPEIVALGEPASISIVIPSHASSARDLYQTLVSLCSQEFSSQAEILVFINEPENATEHVRRTNAYNRDFIRSLKHGTPNGISNELLETWTLLSKRLSLPDNRISLECVHQVVQGGLTGAYQVITASSIARMRTFCDNQTLNSSREEKIKCIEAYLKRSMLLFCDDDMEINSISSVAKAYTHMLHHNAVVLGRLHIQRIDAPGEYNDLLRDLMQLFLDLKYDHGLNFLTPRGILLAHILETGGVQTDQLFADQVFFASAAKGKIPYLIDANTHIAESDHPGNGNFLKKLRLFLQGENNNALDIFENVLQRYREDEHKGRYCAADIEQLILILKTRDIAGISSFLRSRLE